MSTSAQLQFIASLREDEEVHAGDVPLVIPDEAALASLQSSAKPDLDFEKVKILYFGPETLPVSRNDVLAYKNQLGGGFKNAAAPARQSEIASASLPASAVQRSFGLSDESATASAAANAEREKLESILGNLRFETQPLARAWTLPGGNLEALQTQYYNYGLNERLFREYLEHQISLRLNRAQRTRVEISGGHASHAAESRAAPQQQQNEPQKSLYVVGFPLEWTQNELINLFSRFGPIDSAAVIGKKVGPHARGAGFVNFVEIECAVRAVEATHARPIPGREDCRLTVNFARPKPARGT